MVIAIWILAIALSIVVGKDVAQWALSENKKLGEKKRAAQALATKLRDAGLKQIPAMLEDFAIGDVQDMLDRIHDFSRLVLVGGDEAITKELSQTFDNVLAAKLKTPEGLAYLTAKVADAAKSAQTVAQATQDQVTQVATAAAQTAAAAVAAAVVPTAPAAATGPAVAATGPTSPR
jgi:hypothetical protein